MGEKLHVVVLGLSLSSSWGNGHATTFRALIRAFSARGHDVLFLERDVPWYAAHRDLANPDFCRLAFYDSLEDLGAYRDAVAGADAVIVGSYVPDGVAVGRWVQKVARGAAAFYDIDTPVTLAKLERQDFEYLAPDLIPGYDVYFSFTGGPTLERLMRSYGSPDAQALYCSVDPEAYPALDGPKKWDLSYLGTYSPDRQPTVERLLIEPALAAPDLRFVVAGPQYPGDIVWPSNVERIDHVPPQDHPAFYAASRFTLNVTRADMIRAGFSPSVRLFEAASCGTPIISDVWDGIETLLEPDREIALAHDPDEVLQILTTWSEPRRAAMGAKARQHVLAQHTSAHRARTLEEGLRNALSRRRGASRPYVLEVEA
jgi:spore maturation protein CgeB